MQFLSAVFAAIAFSRAVEEMTSCGANRIFVGLLLSTALSCSMCKAKSLVCCYCLLLLLNKPTPGFLLTSPLPWVCWSSPSLVLLVLLLLSSSIMKQGLDVFDSAQNFVLSSFCDEEEGKATWVGHKEVYLNLVLDILLSNWSFQWTGTGMGYRDLHLPFVFPLTSLV